MADAERAVQTRALEEAIEALKGVRGARVELTPAGVKSVRVLVVPERPTTQTIGEVQDIVKDLTGDTVEAARVQVLRAGERIGPLRRRKLSSVLTERTSNRFVARVTLELAGDVLVGESNAPTGQRFEHKSLARATLDGVGRLIDTPLEVQGVFMLTEGEERFAMVVVTTGDDLLVGSAVVKNDEYDAIARATLDAVNRLLALPPREQKLSDRASN